MGLLQNNIVRLTVQLCDAENEHAQSAHSAMETAKEEAEVSALLSPTFAPT